MGDAPTFTEAELEPEERKADNYNQYTVIRERSRKQRVQHCAANRMLKTPEENLFDSLQREFKQCAERFYSILLAKNLRFNQVDHSVIKGSCECLKAYLCWVQRESKKNRELYVPQKQQLEVMRGAVAQDYYQKFSYTAVDFKSDTRKFQHRVVHPPPQLCDPSPDEQQRFKQWLALNEEVGFMSAVITKAATPEERDRQQQVKLQMLMLHQERTGYTLEQYTEDTLRFSGRVMQLSPQLDKPENSAELEAFAKWLGYREQVESFTRQITHLHHRIGRVSDQHHNVEYLAAACLFVHLEKHQELLLFKDMPEFYAACTGLKVPDPVFGMVEQIKSQLGIKPPSLFELVKRNLQMIKRDLTNVAGLVYNDERISLQLETVQQQLDETDNKLNQLEPKHIAAAVLLNSFKEMKGKWNAKFIAEHVPMLGVTAKITEATSAMKYKISLLCKVVENNQKKQL